MRVLQLVGPTKHREVEAITLGGVGTVLVDFGAGTTVATAMVSAPAVTSSSMVQVSVAARASPDHTADEHVVEELDVYAGAPAAGVGFTVYARTRNVRLFGRYTVSYIWS